MVIAEKSSPVVVSLDWLALSAQTLHPYEEGEAFDLPQGWQVIPMTATPTWLLRWYIMDANGNKLATFLTRPRSPKIHACRALVEIANQVLYNTMFPEVVNAILAMYPMVVDGINRADLCGDFMMTAPLWQVVRGLEIGENYLKGIQRGVNWWNAKSANREPHQLSWGGVESVFHWKLYNKYKELHEGNNPLASKPYIEDMWKLCGMEPQSVWRLEVSVTGCNRVLDDNQNVIPWLDWWEKRDYLYSRIYRDKFIIRQHQGHSDKRNDPIVSFLDIGGLDGKFLRHRPPRRELESDAERRVVCKMWKEYVDEEVQGHAILRDAVKEFLIKMLQYPKNIQAISRRYNMTVSEVVSAIMDAQ